LRGLVEHGPRPVVVGVVQHVLLRARHPALAGVVRPLAGPRDGRVGVVEAGAQELRA
jgi:hypothetical protein